MGFFDKKVCDLCGKQYGLLGGKKLEDGLICKDCLKEASPWLGSAKQQSVDEMQRHLAYRKANEEALAAFTPNRTIGTDMKLYIDDRQGLFALSRGDYRKNNADLFRFDQLLSVQFEVNEDRSELSDEEKKKKAGGGTLGQVFTGVANMQSGLSQLEYALGLTPGRDQQGRNYDERNYEYSYRFDFDLDLRHDWISKISFNLSDGFSEGRNSSEFQSKASNALALRDALQGIQQSALRGHSAMGTSTMPGAMPPYGQPPAYGQQAAYGQVPPQVPYGQQQVPYGQQQVPYGQQQVPYAQQQVPYAQQQVPYAQQGNFAQQGAYGQVPQQVTYGQQSAYGQQPPYGQAPPQAPYGQQQQAYGQQASYGQPQAFGQAPQAPAQVGYPSSQVNAGAAGLRRCPYCGSDFSAQQYSACPGCQAPVESM